MNTSLRHIKEHCKKKNTETIKQSHMKGANDIQLVSQEVLWCIVWSSYSKWSK